MLILDTDHLSEFIRGSSAGAMLRQRLLARDAAITIVTLEEQARGWLSRIKQARTHDELIFGYNKLQSLFEVGAAWDVLPWDRASAEVFDGLVGQRPRIGTMDLRIASIVIAGNGTLLSRNLRDFARIDGLKVQNWLE
jgi:tRNA(fMet)-specific endonuclease VapC